MSVTLDLPDSAEMYEVVVEFLRDHHGVVPIAWTEQDARTAAEFLVGVPEGTAINVLATLVAKGSVEKDDVARLVEFKDKHFGSLSGLERVKLQPADTQVGGLTSLRAWLRRKQQIMASDLRGTELRPPRGVLLVGVPGCGKSLSAKAISAEWRLPLYRLDLGAIMGQYVGQSEGRLREALDTADRVAPCVLWIDEIEKGLAGSGTDSTGVTTRLVGQFLYWLQESPARVFVVATANDVRALPQELLRSGRFDDMFFVDLPDAEERREIIQIYLRKYLRVPVPDDVVEELVRLSDGFAGSDVEAAVKEIGYEAIAAADDGDVPVEFYRDAFRNIVPLVRSAPERIDEVRQLRDRAIPASGKVRDSAEKAGSRRVVLG
jgi:SpoVK/Ycf46/Vps4 family AAA+-type ATPase